MSDSAEQKVEQSSNKRINGAASEPHQQQPEETETSDLLPQKMEQDKPPRTGRQKAKKIIRDNAFMIATIAAVIVGFLIGLAVRLCHKDKEISSQLRLWLAMPGELFIRLLKLTILPLIASNVVVVSASLDPKENGKISLVSFGYIMVANTGCAIIGSVTALIVKPGISRSVVDNSTMADIGTSEAPKVTFAKLTSSDVFADLLYNIFPDNLVGVALFKSQTVYRAPLRKQLMQLGMLNSSETNLTEISDTRIVSNSASVNMIGVIFCAAVFGMAARTVGPQGEAFIAFFKSLAQVVIRVMRWFLWLTPPGVCFMIASSIADVVDPASTLIKLGLFIVSVTIALAIHFILLQVVFIAAGRRNPIWFLVKTFRSWCISFATTAPVVAIPEMIECCDSYGIHQEISRFVIPFAAAIKGDGSACFISVAAVFIGQLTGYPISAGTIVIIVLLVSSAMLALPNIPSASLVILVTILTSVGISETEVALLYSVDWLLDRMRSGAIGLSHCYCAAFTHFVCAGDFETSDDNRVGDGGEKATIGKNDEAGKSNGKDLPMVELQA
ncbi:hypothetical protein BOX15_Mlig022109g1 [Macrostomum lignano]|uniref:Amino acid transporter n=2 Tax=Macrostomum lignano TaxID=282301 RepID=A0A267DW43_9PLAT|nr:hypothetical protein BOX15_Mlig022109g1 [Macrostomum lignano]